MKLPSLLATAAVAVSATTAATPIRRARSSRPDPAPERHHEAHDTLLADVAKITAET
jgi:hypothetical protein